MLRLQFARPDTASGRRLRLVGLALLGVIALGGVLSDARSTATARAKPMSPLHADGTLWVTANGSPIVLKGCNLGNWLVQEFWMMDQGSPGVSDQCTLEKNLTERFGYAEKERLIAQFRDNWMKDRDWDQIQGFGFNIVRLPILWSVIEDEKHPKTLRADAWKYLDSAIAQAKKRGIYVILDLHGAVGGQTPNDHTGCAGQNKYWTSAEYQERTRWLWEQIATRYRDEPTVAAYDPLNEPWGSTAEDMEARVTDLYHTIRKIDPTHIVLLPSHYGNIEIYGDPIARGMTNVAFELHPYPGLFGDRPRDTSYAIHRDWLRCGPDGNGGVCAWDQKIKARNIPFLIGEFQPWQSAGIELGGKIARATYDTYGKYGWAATAWSYKVVSANGGQGQGTWGLVTNAIDRQKNAGLGLVAKASTWDCAGWNSRFADACAKRTVPIKVGGSGPQTYYLVIKTGANAGGNPDVTYDKISLVNDATKAEQVRNGDFGTSTGWSTVAISGKTAVEFNDLTPGKAPVGGAGPVLRITRPAGVTGEINGGVYQAVTLQGGQSYTLSGTFHDNGSVDTWAEVYLVSKEPEEGKDIRDGEGRLDFATAPLATIAALFNSFGTQGHDVHAGIKKYLPGKTTTLFTLPKRPTGLQSISSPSGVTLRWAKNSEADVTGYRVYRSLTPKSGAVPIADVKTNQYRDSSVKDSVDYYYTVSAIDAEDESYRSEEVVAGKNRIVDKTSQIRITPASSRTGK